MKRGEELKCGEELKKGEEWKRGEEWKSGEEFDGKSWIEKCWIEISNPRPEIKISLKLSMLQLCIELRPSRHFFRGFFPSSKIRVILGLYFPVNPGQGCKGQFLLIYLQPAIT